MADSKPAVDVVHSLPGRTRLRVHGVRLDATAAERLADQIAGLSGVIDVEVNRRSGGVLCHHEPDLQAASLVSAAAGVIERLEATNGKGDVLDGPPPSAAIARELAEVFRSTDRDVRRLTDGRLDLATLATFTFLGAGAVEVALRGELPAPPWFNLAWWGFRTFMTFEPGVLGLMRNQEETAKREA